MTEYESDPLAEHATVTLSASGRDTRHGVRLASASVTALVAAASAAIGGAFARQKCGCVPVPAEFAGVVLSHALGIGCMTGGLGAILGMIIGAFRGAHTGEPLRAALIMTLCGGAGALVGF